MIVKTKELEKNKINVPMKKQDVCDFLEYMVLNRENDKINNRDVNRDGGKTRFELD